ncbi:MAG TPA: elongation factor 3, partial [Brevundimonas sp.]|nr:elongation factor 3 [Brevundimonas sp.]
KTTLARLLSSQLDPVEGAMNAPGKLKVGYFTQYQVEELASEETPLELMTRAMEGKTPAAVRAQLGRFGFSGPRATQKVEKLSGGERARLALALITRDAPHLLILDEPTNHLDILAIELLEEELISARCAILVVSHDRAFLNRVTQTCHWLEGRRVRSLSKSFNAFDEWATKVTEEEAESLRRLSKTIERETATFYSSITARRTRNEGRARSLEALRAERAERLKDVPRDLHLGVDSGAMSGKLVADLKGISKGFGERTVIKPFTTRIVRGDRLAIVGPNGAGKTTLVKIMLGELAPDTGTVRLGANLDPVYLDQSREGLKSDMTLWDALTPGGGDSILVRGVSKHVAAYAKDFLFQEGQLRQPISTLSGGERNRLLLARALAKPANMLVLDEPTNDLDVETLRALEDAIENFAGCAVVIS